jgi:hypothetical protein
MGEILAALERFLATSHPVNEAAFLVEVSRHDLPYQLVGVTALLSGGLRQPGLLLGCEMYFHALQGTSKPRVRQHGKPTHDGLIGWMANRDLSENGDMVQN